MPTNGSSSNASSMVDKAKTFATRLTPVQKIALGAVILTVVAGGLVLSRGGSAVPMGPLYTDLNSTDAASVVDSLSSQGVAYELADAGRTVLVPQDQVYDLRVTLAGEGLPTSNEGYALLDNQGITTSEFRQRIDYQRALEGELAMTLTALDGVESASVHLALPDQSVFIDEPATPTASVLVAARGLDSISDSEVEAIVHLVASSVKDMKPEGVTVIDANGTVLSAAGAGGGGGVGGGGDRAKAEASFEARLGAELTAMLTRMTGPNKVAVTVSAKLDLDQTQTTTEDYGPLGKDPEEVNVLTQSASKEAYDSSAANGAGDAGVLGPDGTIQDGQVPGSVEDALTTGYLNTGDTSTFGVDRVVEQKVIVPGTVSDLNVAVLIDESAVTEAQLAEIQKLVETASGIDVEKGQFVTITRMPFDTASSTEADAMAKAEAAAESKAQMMGLGRTIAVLLVILIALFLGYRSAKNARRVTVTPIDIGEITSSSGSRGSLSAGPANALDAGDATAELDPPISFARPPDRDDIVMQELTTMADRRPQEVANVLKAWLAESNKAGRR